MVRLPAEGPPPDAGSVPAQPADRHRVIQGEVMDPPWAPGLNLVWSRLKKPLRAALDAIGARTEEDGFMPLVNVVLSGDLYNAQFMLQARPYEEQLDFYNINPGVTFEFTNECFYLCQCSRIRRRKRRRHEKKINS